MPLAIWLCGDIPPGDGNDPGTAVAKDIEEDKESIGGTVDEDHGLYLEFKVPGVKMGRVVDAKDTPPKGL